VQATADAKRRNEFSSTVLVLAAGVLWSFSGVLIKTIHWDFLRVAGARSLIGGLLQFVFLVAALRRETTAGHLPNGSLPIAQAFKVAAGRILIRNKPHWIGACLFVVNMLALAWAFRLTNATNAVFLHYSGIVLVALLSHRVLKQQLWRQDWIAVAAATFGIFLFCVDGWQCNARLGTALGVLCGLTLAGTNLALGMRSQDNTNPRAALETVVLANLLTVIITAPIMLLNLHDLPTGRDCLWLVLLGIFPWALPDVMYVTAIRRVPVFRALILGLSDPILTGLWPLLFLKEYPSLIAVVGSLIVLWAIIYQAAASSASARQS